MNHIRARSIATMGLTYYRLWRVIIKKTKVPRARYANVLLLSYLILNNMKYGGGGNWFFLFIVQVI